MPDPGAPHGPETDLTREIAALRAEIHTLNAQRFLSLNGSVWKMLGVQFLRGLAMGLGTVMGASALVSALAYWLGQIDFIPVIGDWASQVARAMQDAAQQQ